MASAPVFGANAVEEVEGEGKGAEGPLIQYRQRVMMTPATMYRRRADGRRGGNAGERILLSMALSGGIRAPDRDRDSVKSVRLRPPVMYRVEQMQVQVQLWRLALPGQIESARLRKKRKMW